MAKIVLDIQITMDENPYSREQLKARLEGFARTFGNGILEQYTLGDLDHNGEIHMEWASSNV